MTSERRRTAPLSSAQESVWFQEQLAPGTSAFASRLTLRLTGPLDVEVFRDALTDLVARHEALHVCLTGDVPPAQVLMTPTRVQLDGPEDALEAPFQLRLGPLWRAQLAETAAEEHVLTWIAHDLIFDRQSARVFVSELAELYTARKGGRPPRFGPEPVQHRDLAAREREAVRGNGDRADLSYWCEVLSDAPIVAVPRDRPRPIESTFRSARSRVPLPNRISSHVFDLARELDVTRHAVFLGAFSVLLHRYTRQQDLVIGCHARPLGEPSAAGTIGAVDNLLPIRIDITGNPTFTDLVARVDKTIAAARQHAIVPFAEILRAVAPPRDIEPTPLVQVAFEPPEQPMGMKMDRVIVAGDVAMSLGREVDMSWRVEEAATHSTVDVLYSTDVLDAETVQAMQSHYGRLLADLINRPTSRVSTAEMLSKDECDELINRWDGERVTVRGGSIDQWFEEHVAVAPDATAVVAGDRSLTYGQLDESANRLAHLLLDVGIRDDDLVALVLPRGLEYPVAALGVLKAGAAFVPIDRSAPQLRIATLLRDSAPRAVITMSSLEPTLPAKTPAVISLDRVAEELSCRSPKAPPKTRSGADLAYVMYTSGSTGTPRGVLIEHRCVVNLISSVQRLFALTPADRVLAYAAYTFDVSIFETFGALLTGGQLRVALDDDRLDLHRLQHVLQDGITVIDLPPSVMALLDPSQLSTLRISFVGGEPFPGELVNRWNQVSRFFNGYGPTESTVTMIVQECEGHWRTSPPIGLPMANHVAYVLDEDLRPVPYGAPGELVIGGAGLARGYLNEHELTSQRFVPNPFATPSVDRLYRTGDLVKRRRDGVLVFLGRVDRQLKVRGIRIEPGEIEAVLAAEPGVRQAYVDVTTAQNGRRQLVAYVGASGEDAPTPSVLRAAMASKLPSSMVPQDLLVMPELPLTVNGKIDRRALPRPHDVAASRSTVGPRTPTEEALVTEVLALLLPGPADVTASFFALGGTSLDAVRVVATVATRFDVDITLADFLRTPTIAGLAALIDEQRSDTWPTDIW